ncbi:hypothetical protein [Fibrella aquatica]|uniref:hypothetical protein n=1 Tax=Fibrella aquatica TaxID=3242487 RepID=UPI0035230691
MQPVKRLYIANDDHTDYMWTVDEAQLAGIGIGVPGFVFANGTVDSNYGFLELWRIIRWHATSVSSMNSPVFSIMMRGW